VGSRLTVPTFIWDAPPRAEYGAPRILGLEDVDGVPTRIVSFFVQVGQTPYWYRLWVDRDGLVRRAEMRGQGHFMDHHYRDFDAALRIEPPSS